MAAEFQGQFMEAMREAELDALRKEVDETNIALRKPIDLDAAFDPLIEARKQMTEAIAAQTRLTPPKPAQPAAGDKDTDPAGDARA